MFSDAANPRFPAELGLGVKESCELAVSERPQIMNPTSNRFRFCFGGKKGMRGNAIIALNT